MISKTSAALLILLSVACASTPSSPDGGAGVATTRATLPSARNAPDYVLLSSPNQVRPYDFGSAVGVRGLHIRGIMTTAGFLPIGDVQGNGTFCADGRDWLSVSDMKLHKAADGKTPTAPYVLGCVTGASFQPSSRTIVAQ